MADNTRIYSAKFNVADAIASINRMRSAMIDADKSIKASLKSTSGQALNLRKALEKAKASIKSTGKTSKRSSTVVQRAVSQEKSARDKLTAAMGGYRKVVKDGGKEAVRAARDSERATKSARIEAERYARTVAKAQASIRRTFLDIGKDTKNGIGSMAKYAAVGAASIIGIHKGISAIGSARERYTRFDELTTSTLAIAKAGDDAFAHSTEGARQFRDAIREAASDMQTTSDKMADSALFWSKAGLTNADSIVELSKVGTLFASANRDAANNILDQARANDVLSDALQLFRKDTSSPEKAMTEAMRLGDKLTAAANASNIVVEQLFEYSKKVGGLFKAGEVADDEILAIASSLASAGLKEESGVHVRRILTQLAQSNVQNMLAKSGIAVTDDDGNLRSFGKIFGELQETLKNQKPMERMGYLKDLFGQRAISTAAALAGLNEEGVPGETSIDAILAKIAEAQGLMERNRAEYLKTARGRMEALTSRWASEMDRVLENSSLIQSVLSGIEKINPRSLFDWIENSAIPALQSFGSVMSNTVIPAIQIAASNIKEFLAPAMSMFSALIGGTTGNGEKLGRVLTTVIKLWIQWRVALLALKGLRMIEWVASLTRNIRVAAGAMGQIGTATQTAVSTASKSLWSLPSILSGVGTAIGAAIIGWNIGSIIYDHFLKPVRDAANEMSLLQVTSDRSLQRRSVDDLIKSKAKLEERGDDPEVIEQIKRIDVAITSIIEKQNTPPREYQTEDEIIQRQSEIQKEQQKISLNIDGLVGRIADASATDQAIWTKMLEEQKAANKDLKDEYRTLGFQLSQIADNTGLTAEKTPDPKKPVMRPRPSGRIRAKDDNPFVFPVSSGIDLKGDRVINLATEKGNASDYFAKSPEARQMLANSLETKRGIQSVHFGDTSITVSAQTDASPMEIARAVKDEFWKIGKQQQRDVQRVLSGHAIREY